MSAASAKTQEPSMEEILASIRRIIADDQEGGRPEAPPPRPSRPPAEVEAEEAHDEVLDLAQVAQPAKPAPSLDLEHEDISFDDGQIDFDSIDIEEPEPEPEIEPEPEPEPELEVEEDDADVFLAMDEDVPPPRAEMQDRLLSATTDAAVGHAFNMLAHTVLSNNARTLEDLVKDMLKPMLKVWLDDNLPVMVERMVRAEIERVARGNR